jgi:hypothetical protein
MTAVRSLPLADPSTLGMMGVVRAWKVAGQCCAVAGWLLWIAVQLVARDPFPPDISFSQYGLGATGWLFSVWVVVLAVAPLLLFAYRPVPGPARWLLLIGFAGTLVMAVVRTDEGGVQMSTNATVHMVGAVIALVFVPLGTAFVLRFAARPWRWLGVGLITAAAVIGSLVLLAAAGVNTAGRGPAQDWALWQGVLVLLEMVLVGLYALVVSTVDPRSGRARPIAPVQSAVR